LGVAKQLSEGIAQDSFGAGQSGRGGRGSFLLGGGDGSLSLGSGLLERVDLLGVFVDFGFQDLLLFVESLLLLGELLLLVLQLLLFRF